MNQSTLVLVILGCILLLYIIIELIQYIRKKAFLIPNTNFPVSNKQQLEQNRLAQESTTDSLNKVPNTCSDIEKGKQRYEITDKFIISLKNEKILEYYHIIIYI